MSHSSPHHRSAPIPIRQLSSGPLAPAPDSDDRDTDSDTDNNHEDVLRVGSLPTKQRGFVVSRTTSSSMPAAPRLLSRRSGPPVPVAALPPTGVSTIPTVPNAMSYGSLRESHLGGRFLDGPSSYRDSRSGEIRRCDVSLPEQMLSMSLTGLELLTKQRDDWLAPTAIEVAEDDDVLMSPVRSLESRELDSGEQDDSSGNPDTDEVFDLDME